MVERPRITRPGEDYATEESRANLRLSLFEAIAWSNERADFSNRRHCLRTPTLAPHIFNESRHATVFDVVSNRHSLLKQTGQKLRGMQPGRLLAWERDPTIDDGIGEAETEGFLDESDMPPWDTWIAYSDGFGRYGVLVSWVPDVFVPSVDVAIRCNAYDALYWLCGSDTLIARVLEADGICV